MSMMLYLINSVNTIVCFFTTRLSTIILFVAPTVSFGESAYTVDEHDGPALLAVVLSNPSSIDITINVVTTDVSATGNCL